MKLLRLSLLFLLVSLPVFGQSFVPTHHESTIKKVLLAPFKEVGRTAVDMVTFRDKPFAIAAWAYVGAYTADMVSTHTAFSRCLGCVEGGLFARNSRSSGQVTAAWGGVAIANLTVAHLWKREAPTSIKWAWPAGLAFLGTEHALFAYHNFGYSSLRPGQPCPANFTVADGGSCTF